MCGRSLQRNTRPPSIHLDGCIMETLDLDEAITDPSHVQSLLTRRPPPPLEASPPSRSSQSSSSVRPLHHVPLRRPLHLVHIRRLPEALSSERRRHHLELLFWISNTNLLERRT
ncbi:hypothetical protein PIB30_021797 [Stylosanthes scabra]|uniref:Uncharacterized protein n=1 Tax=Stylosanthes scabra TaxID=79078 RepID=A0ABU6W7H1_9FABA|nr:hypothetical protein [Stylosanthes scabra]